MKILVISLPDLRKIPPQRPHYFLNWLSKKHEVTVISVNAWWLEEREDSKKMLEDVEYYYITEKKLHPVLQELLIWTHIPKIKRNKHDIIINFNTLFAGLCLKIFLRETPMLLDIADELMAGILDSPNFPSLLKNGISKRLLQRLFVANLSLADMVTIISKNLKRLYDAPHAKIVPNGVEISRYSFSNSGISKKKSERILTVGFVGVLREWVDFRPLFKAISILKRKGIPASVLVVGDGPNKPTLLARELGVDDRVKFMGFVSHDKVSECIQQMDVGVIPFNKAKIAVYSFPIKALEYLASGKIVLSSDIPALGSELDKAILFVTDVDEYANSLLTLFFNPKLRKKKGIIGKKIVNKNYSWGNISNNFNDVLNALKVLNNESCSS